MAEKIKLGSNGNFGVKEGGTLAFNDENGVFKAIELASSRASGATYVAQSGLIADAEVGVPRIDWTNGVGELLLEPQSTNEITYSEDFTQAVWLKINLGTASLPVVNSNQAIAPDGTLTADQIDFDLNGGTDRSEIQANIVTTIGQSVIYSIWLKTTDGSTKTMVMNFNGTGPDLAPYDNPIITVTGEWQRFVIGLTSAGVTTARLRLGLTTGTSDSASIYAWGGQGELNINYPTSYIRTEGSAVTRIADAVTGNSSLGQVINSSEGVLYFEGSALVNTPTLNAIIRIENSGDASNESLLFRYDNSANRVRIIIRTGGINQINSTKILVDTTLNNKFALKWKEDDISLWINGVEEITTSSALVAVGLDTLKTEFFYGRIRELKVYDTALTDAELQTLTTL